MHISWINPLQHATGAADERGRVQSGSRLACDRRANGCAIKWNITFDHGLLAAATMYSVGIRPEFSTSARGVALIVSTIPPAAGEFRDVSGPSWHELLSIALVRRTIIRKQNGTFRLTGSRYTCTGNGKLLAVGKTRLRLIDKTVYFPVYRKLF